MADADGDNGRYKIIHDLEEETETLRDGLDAAGWQRTEAAWDLLWTNHLPDRSYFTELTARQRINHYPGIEPLIRKDELHAHLAAADLNPHRRWDFPRSFSMPDHYDELRDIAAADTSQSWIVKDRIGSMGRGMHLVRDIDALEPDPFTIVQRYIDAPLLFDEAPFKHVLRVYALITMLEPLTVYVYPETVVKVTSKPYRSARHTHDDLAIHLTNPTVQMTNTAVDDPVRAIDRQTFADRLRSVGVDDAVLWQDVRQMVGDVLTVFAPTVATISSVLTRWTTSCFDLVGFDILVDSDARPWLLECNLSPSLETRSDPATVAGRAQRLAKHGAVNDMLRIVGVGTGGFRSADPHARVAEEAGHLGRYEPLVVLGEAVPPPAT